MTISDFMARVNQNRMTPGAAEAMAQNTDIWDNSACKGYTLAAAKSANLSEEQVEALMRCMTTAFDSMDVDTAADQYNRSRY